MNWKILTDQRSFFFKINDGSYIIKENVKANRIGGGDVLCHVTQKMSERAIVKNKITLRL